MYPHQHNISTFLIPAWSWSTGFSFVNVLKEMLLSLFPSIFLNQYYPTQNIMYLSNFGLLHLFNKEAVMY